VCAMVLRPLPPTSGDRVRNHEVVINRSDPPETFARWATRPPDDVEAEQAGVGSRYFDSRIARSEGGWRNAAFCVLRFAYQ